jgi:hypothetical protein
MRPKTMLIFNIIQSCDKKLRKFPDRYAIRSPNTTDKIPSGVINLIRRLSIPNN